VYSWSRVPPNVRSADDAHRVGGLAVAWIRPGGDSELVTCWGKRAIEGGGAGGTWAVYAHDVERYAATRWRVHEDARQVAEDDARPGAPEAGFVVHFFC
jgi:hypothetical protein